MTDLLAPLAYQMEKPEITATFKALPEDFQVVEVSSVNFATEGEHLMVLIQKTGENTAFVANEIAKFCGVPSKAVSWAGLKDRHATTSQWLSIHLPKGEMPDFALFEAHLPSVKVLEVTRHTQKLRTGDLLANKFMIRLRQVSDMDALMNKLNQVSTQTLPNYFGAQRFGREGNNLQEARRWGRDNVRTRNANKRSLYLSTARAWIFNQVLSYRIENNLLSQAIDGDIVFDSDQNIILVNKENQSQIQSLIDLKNNLLTGPLAGDNQPQTQHKAQALEMMFFEQEPDLMALIRGNRMQHDRRALTLQPSDFSWELIEDFIELRFTLPKGSFATSLLRELAILKEPTRTYPA